jgi:threonine dehydratase
MDLNGANDWHNLIAPIQEASQRIYCLARETPLIRLPRDPRVPESCRVFAKMEQQQVTGSFKVRGATNKIFSLAEEVAARGVVASSTGNHGLGVAAAAHARGIDAEIFLSSQVPEGKRKKIESYGALIRTVGNNPLDAELAARAAAADFGQCYISPYNDWQVVAGQGTIAVELLRQLEPIDAIFVAAGGGGLISGIGSYCKAHSPQTEVVGCWPENSRVLYESLRVGSIVDYPETYTLSESTAGAVESGSITFDLARDVVSHCRTVDESAILEAMVWAHQHGWTIEGSAAVALATFFEDAAQYANKSVVVVFCGGNLSPEVEARLHERLSAERPA